MLLFILAVVGYFLPQTVSVERSTIIGNTRDAVYTKLNSMQRFNDWSPWFQMDPNAKYQFSGPQEGQGSKMAWDSEDPKLGAGTLEIVDNQYPSMIKTELFFGQDPNPGYATFRIEEITFKQTKVTWTFSADFGNNLIGRYIGLMMEEQVGTVYQQGLDNLKIQLEK